MCSFCALGSFKKTPTRNHVVGVCLARFQTRAGREDVFCVVCCGDFFQNRNILLLWWECWSGAAGPDFKIIGHNVHVFCVLLSSFSKFIIGNHVEEHECLALWDRVRNHYRTRSCVLCAAVDLFETTL
jgi:hypothetical protein